MIGIFQKPAVEVSAVQFVDTEECRLEIFRWLNGCFYVPAATDGEYRLVEEYDEEGLVLSSAPPFLIIKTRSGYDRVDITDWIVRYDEIRISTYSDLDFSFNFVKS